MNENIDTIIWSKFFPQTAGNKPAQDAIRFKMGLATARIEEDCAYVIIVGLHLQRNMTDYLGNLLEIRVLGRSSDQQQLLEDFFLKEEEGYKLAQARKKRKVVLWNEKIGTTIHLNYAPDSMTSPATLDIWVRTFLSYTPDSVASYASPKFDVYFKGLKIEDGKDGTIDRIVEQDMRLRVPCTRSVDWFYVASNMMRYEKPPFNMRPQIIESMWASILHQFFESMNKQDIVKAILSWNSMVMEQATANSQIRMFLLSVNPQSPLNRKQQLTIEPDLVILSLEKNLVVALGLGLWQLTVGKQRDVLKRLVRGRFAPMWNSLSLDDHKEEAQMWNERVYRPCVSDLFSSDDVLYANDKQTEIPLASFYHDDFYFYQETADRGVAVSLDDLRFKITTCSRRPQSTTTQQGVEKIYEYLTGLRNRCVFLFPSSQPEDPPFHAWCANRGMLLDQQKNVVFECLDEDSMTLHQSVQIQRPYVELNISDVPIYVPQDNLEVVLNHINSSPLFMVHSLPYQLRLSTSQAATTNPSPIWRDHCQTGSNKQLSIIYPINNIQLADLKPSQKTE